MMLTIALYSLLGKRYYMCMLEIYTCSKKGHALVNICEYSMGIVYYNRLVKKKT